MAAAGAASSPIPFSDAAILAPIQITMITKIYKAYGKSVSEGVVKGIVTATVVSALGKGVVGNLIKFIPGLGSISGAVINGGVAVSITEGLGFYLADAFENNEIDNSEDLARVVKQFMLNFKK